MQRKVKAEVEQAKQGAYDDLYANLDRKRLIYTGWACRETDGSSR